MLVPLGIGAYKRADGFVPEVRCLNMYVEKDDSGLSPDKTLRIQRPGIVQHAKFTESVRSLAYWPARTAQVVLSGSSLYIDGFLVPGSVLGAGMSPIAATAFMLAMAAGEKLYLYDTALTEVTLPEGRVTQDVDQINSYVIVATPDGRFYWVEPNEKTIDPLNFATAESSADGLKAVRRLGDEIWLFGQESIEVWQPTGDSDLPFARAPGRLFQRGCLERDTVRRFDNALVWVGEDGSVYRAAAVPQYISNPGIDERIRKRTNRLSAWTFKSDGHEFYVLNVPGQGSFAYDASTQEWCEFASPGKIGWDATMGYDSPDGITYASGLSSNSVWRVNEAVTTDLGVPFERIVTGTVSIMGQTPRNDSISIGVGASVDCVIRLRHKDGQNEFPAYYEELDARAPIDICNMYRLGMPEQPYRTFEISCVDDARIRIAGMVANGAWK